MSWIMTSLDSPYYYAKWGWKPRDPAEITVEIGIFFFW